MSIYLMFLCVYDYILWIKHTVSPSIYETTTTIAATTNNNNNDYDNNL